MPINENTDLKKSENEDRTTKHHSKIESRGWIIVIAIAAIVIVAMACGMAHMQRNFGNDGFMPAFSHTRGGRMHENRRFLNDDNNTTYSGVVTSIKDNSFTLSGNGQQVTINTSDNTTYNNTSKKVSVNDSVLVFGTKSDNTIAAASIRIINY